MSIVPTICISGGHLTPAVAVIQQMRHMHPDWNIHFVGRLHPFDNDSIESEEAHVASMLEIPFHPLVAVRFQRFFSMSNFMLFFTFPLSLYRAYLILRTIEPSIFLSFGGYIALPLAIAAWILRIPVVTHEQTQTSGLANSIISHFARVVLFSFPPKSRPLGSSERVTGLPIRTELFQASLDTPTFIKSTLPTLYIMGGVTGAQSLNALIYPIVHSLICSFTVVHQVGRYSLKQARVIRNRLRGDRRARYVVLPYLDSGDHAWMMQRAKLILSRSGANTVAEIEAMGKVAIFIPLPWSANHEQQANAERVVKKQMAVTIDQQHINSEKLYQTIMDVVKNMYIYEEAAKGVRARAKKDHAPRAAISIVEAVEGCLEKSGEKR